MGPQAAEAAQGLPRAAGSGAEPPPPAAPAPFPAPRPPPLPCRRVHTGHVTAVPRGSWVPLHAGLVPSALLPRL